MTTLKFDAEYASKVLKKIPAGYIDKTVCGCGLSSVALENDVNTIIIVPTVQLANNKAQQYPNERSNNEVLAVWGDTRKEDIEDYVERVIVIKIICVYDSLPKVEYLLDRCHLVIDESNELLSLTKERPDAIDNVFRIAYENKESVSFISATPIPLRYMPKWISTIEQVKIEWSNTKKAVPIICERTYPFKSLKEEFIKPLYEKKVLTVASRTFRKVIVFVNTVQQAANIIKESGIDKNDCAIICGDTIKNDIKIIGIPRLKNPKKLPMITFATSSGFSGIDLYDNEAMTIVVSSTNKKWQMIDLLTDLKQAISRQRDKSNPNYNTFIYIYNQSLFSKSE